MTTTERLFGWRHAFDQPFTGDVTALLVVLLAVAPVILWALGRSGRVSPELAREMWLRYRSWLALVPLLLVPILAGAAFTIVGFGVLGVLCYREYAGAVGLGRERALNALVVVGIALTTFAALDNWLRFFLALFPMIVALIAAAAVLADRPADYARRVALVIFGYALCGSALGHLAFLGNDADYRPLVLLLVVAVELNDIFAFISGKRFGRRKLAPHTSPGKTVGGAVGALVLTTLLVYALGGIAFAGTALARPAHRLALGVLISVGGQLGDLVLSAIKRDAGLKDIGHAIPGHGGLLDRFDSLLIVAPLYFHYVNYVLWIGADQTQRILTGGG
ncbi:MAG: phosphatidate cytidylyltransferase [Ardenticatenales bacterium]